MATRSEQIEIVKISPEDAERMLTENFDANRRIAVQRVAAYAADMAAGKWLLTSDPIRFDAAGRLIDGQHRLRACVQAEVPFETAVATGLDHNIVSVIDVGRGRSLRDALTVSGYSTAGLAQTIVKTAAYERYMSDKIMKPKDGETKPRRAQGSTARRGKAFKLYTSELLTRPAAFALLDKRPGLIPSTQAVAGCTGNRKQQVVRPPTGTIALMHNIAEFGYGGGSVIEFVEAVRSGYGTVEDPTYNLNGLLVRAMLAKAKGGKTRSDMLDYQAVDLLWFRAYAQWTGDEPVKNLKRSHGRAYPTIPGDIDWYLSVAENRNT